MWQVTLVQPRDLLIGEGPFLAVIVLQTSSHPSKVHPWNEQAVLCPVLVSPNWDRRDKSPLLTPEKKCLHKQDGSTENRQQEKGLTAIAPAIAALQQKPQVYPFATSSTGVKKLFYSKSSGFLPLKVFNLLLLPATRVSIVLKRREDR